MNIYGLNKFSYCKARKHVDDLEGHFRSFCSARNYKEHESVPISSGIDPTVRFIGSHISVFKPYIFAGEIPDPGYFMRQNCLRTQNAKRLLDSSYNPVWGSYFPSLGVISRSGRLEFVCDESVRFFRDELQIPDSLIRYRVSSRDVDLFGACEETCDPRTIEPDTQKPDYYRHKYGMQGVWGRSFNIALRDHNAESFSDVGNIIIIENEQGVLGIELALGASTILKQMYDLDHVNDCHSVPSLPCDNKGLRRKFEDAVIVSVVLFREGLRPSGSKNKNRILRSYVRSLSYFRAKAQMSIDCLSQILSEFELLEFSNSDVTVSGDIVNYVARYESDLGNGIIRSPEDWAIWDALIA